ncbi:DNA topoisomerase-1 [Paraburkholderia unamae]|uniref:DNA topoisomerase IB n=1 Tax=Paraburkholderia unamae TaxID=219649 RepID=UPI000DC32881|nr:DNA topoisomerase-1 [Paraburkholderia unamae]
MATVRTRSVSRKRHSTGSGVAISRTESAPPGLRYVDDSRPGYRRERVGDTFAYYNTQGARIQDDAEIRRINALAIPPAYTDVWICPDARGHLQATGRDARGRKQYRYHPRWRETRDATKFERMLAFGAALPKLRARVARDLMLDGMPRDKVLAAVVRLLDITLIRVGSEEYARENRSYGLTTLRKCHLKVSSEQLRFKFRGKSGIEHDVAVSDARIARVVRHCMELPGRDLFQYLDADRAAHTVNSSDINDYLHEITAAEFTAKDYRTWAGSVFALSALSKLEWTTVTQARAHVVETIKQVSQLLRNTPSVCRKCYVHPAVLEAFEAGALAQALRSVHRSRLSADEAALVVFLNRDARRRARKALRQENKDERGGASLAALLEQSRRKARASGPRHGVQGKAAKTQEPEASGTLSQPARPSAAKKLARVRSRTAVTAV